jgi:hypothetical protein
MHKLANKNCGQRAVVRSRVTTQHGAARLPHA